MANPPIEQEREPKGKVVAGSVSASEETEIIQAFQGANLPNKSRAARAILLAFSRSTKVRDAVAEFLRENIEILAG